MGQFDWIEQGATTLKGTESDYKAEWEAQRFMLAGKMYAMLGAYKDGRPILTLKLPPEECDEARRRHEGQAIPGYYMNKEHWVSLFLDAGLAREEVLAYLGRSYEAFLQGLPKGKRLQITEG